MAREQDEPDNQFHLNELLDLNDPNFGSKMADFNAEMSLEGGASSLLPPEAQPTELFKSEYPKRFITQMVTLSGPMGEEQTAAQNLHDLGLEIRALRGEELSRKNIADLTGIEPDFIFYLEKGLVTSSEARIMIGVIGKALQVDTSHLTSLLERGWEPPSL